MPNLSIPKFYIAMVSVFISLVVLLEGCLVFKRVPYFSVVSEEAKYYLEGDLRERRVFSKELSSGRGLKMWEGSYVSSIKSVDIRDDSLAIFAAGDAIDVWDIIRGEMIGHYKTDGTAVYGGLSMDGKYVVGIYLKPVQLQSYVRVWDAKTKQEIWSSRFDDDKIGMASIVGITRDTSLIAVAGFGGIKVYPGPAYWQEKPVQVAAFQYRGLTKARAVAFSQDGRFLAVALSDWENRTQDEIRVYDLNAKMLLWISPPQMKSIWMVRFNYNGEYVMAGQTDIFSESLSKDWDITVWRATTGESVLQKTLPDVLNVSTDGRIYSKRQGSDVLEVLYWGGSWIEDMTNVSPDKDLDKLAEEIIQLTGPNDQRIAHLEFPQDNQQFRNFEIFLRQEIANRIIKKGHVSIVGPELQEKAMQKLHSGGRYPLESSEAIKFGELTGATILIYSALADQEKTVTLDLEVVGIDNPGIGGQISTKFLKGPVVQNLINK